MKDKEIILGINTSHDTSVAVLEDGVLIDVFEEERSRRSKYWSPVEDHPYDNFVCYALPTNNSTTLHI